MYCERCDKLGFNKCYCNKKNLVDDLVKEHRNTWENRSNLFWYVSLLEEVMELGLSLLGLHKDKPGFELAQIASIAINWRNRSV